MDKLTTISLILPLILAPLFTLQTRGEAAKVTGKATDYVPVGTVEHRSVVFPTATSYQPFQLCLSCRCCSAADPSNCVSTSCCYAIDCNLPGKPFGVCAFTPQTCDCTNCTQS